MSALTLAFYRLRWLHVPAALLMFLLQRAPMLRTVVTTEFVLTSGASQILKGILLGSTALGTVQTVAGATELTADDGGNPASATVGESFAGGFAVTGAPAVAASYEVRGDVPPGLTVTGIVGDTVNDNAVSITGTPTEAGEFTLLIRAWRGPNKTAQGGTPQFEYTINVSAAESTAPTITTQPTSAAVPPDGSVTLTVQASGDPTPSFQWQKDGVNIDGAESASLNIASVSAADAGDYTVVVSNASGSVTSAPASLQIVNPGDGVTISSSPASVDVSSGGTATFSVAASSTGGLTYQWFRYKAGEGLRSLAGETSPTLQISSATAADMGFYFARVSDGAETVDSDYAILTLTGGTSRLANLSTRGSVPANGTLIPGFVIDGTGTKDIVVRAAGPLLGEFGVGAAMEDPELALVSSKDPRLTNDDWQGSTNVSALVTASAAVGAQSFLDGSKDAAILTTLPLREEGGSKVYTVEVSATDGAPGIALAEVYDTELSAESSRLTNVSARGFSGTGESALIPGFVIAGEGAKTILIRVVGPTLADFGVPGTMADPRLEVIPGGESFVIAENDNWGGTLELKAAFATTGAFSFSEEASLDAAVLVRLPPGAYTVRPSGADGGTGEILVEAYEVPE